MKTMIRIQNQFSGSRQKEAFRAALKKFDRIALIEKLKACSKSNNPFYVDFDIKDVYVIQMLIANGLKISKSLFSRKKKGVHARFDRWEMHVLKSIEISFLNYVRELINEFKLNSIKTKKHEHKTSKLSRQKAKSV